MRKKMVGGIAIVLILIVVVGIGITAKKDDGKNNAILTEEKAKEILGDKGEIVSFEKSEKEIVIDIVAKGDVKEIAKSISKEQKDDERITVNFIEENIKANDDFYFEGLNKRAIISKNEKTLESFEKKEIEKAKVMEAEFKDNKILENKEGNIVIETTVTKIDDKNAMGEIKAYLEMFKEINKEKKLNNVQVNFKGNEKGYKYNEKFKDIFATVENIG